MRGLVLLPLPALRTFRKSVTQRQQAAAWTGLQAAGGQWKRPSRGGFSVSENRSTYVLVTRYCSCRVATIEEAAASLLGPRNLHTFSPGLLPAGQTHP